MDELLRLQNIEMMKAGSVRMWEMEEYTDECLSDMRDMIEEYYGDIEISHIFFLEHQYFRNPAGDALVKLAYDRSENENILAGQYITIPMRVRIQGTEHKAILSLNTLTRERYRGQKIFTSLAEKMFRECEQTQIRFCYGLPNPNSYHGFIHKLQFQEIGRIPLYLRILSPSKLARNKWNSIFLGKVCWMADIFFRTKKNDYAYKILKIDNKNSNLIDEFWQLVRDKYPVMMIRDKEYISWRYLDIPLKEYEIFMVFDHEQPAGYAVYRITDVGNMRCGMIVDFLMKSKTEEAGRYLINYILNIFVEEEVEISGCLMQSYFEEAGILREEGFFVCPRFLEPQSFPVVCRTFDSDISKAGVIDFRNWFLTMGDYDAI